MVALEDNCLYFSNSMKNQKVRRVIFYKNYFSNFFIKQRGKVKEKILWTLRLIENIQHIPVEYFKHIEGTNGLYEIRVKQRTDIFRIFCFFDETNIIVIIKGFQKKSQRIQRNEIEKAIKIMREYYEEQKS